MWLKRIPACVRCARAVRRAVLRRRLRQLCRQARDPAPPFRRSAFREAFRPFCHGVCTSGSMPDWQQHNAGPPRVQHVPDFHDGRRTSALGKPVPPVQQTACGVSPECSNPDASGGVKFWSLFSLKRSAFQAIGLPFRKTTRFSARFWPGGAVLPPRVPPFSIAKHSGRNATSRNGIPERGTDLPAQGQGNVRQPRALPDGARGAAGQDPAEAALTGARHAQDGQTAEAAGVLSGGLQ